MSNVSKDYRKAAELAGKGDKFCKLFLGICADVAPIESAVVCRIREVREQQVARGNVCEQSNINA